MNQLRMIPAASLLLAAFAPANAPAQSVYMWADGQGIANYGPACPSGTRCFSITPARIASTSSGTSSGTSGTSGTGGTSGTSGSGTQSGSSASTQTGGTAPAATNVLWTANHDSGDLRDWYKPCPNEGTVNGYNAFACTGQGGQESNDPGADSSASRDVARSGAYSLKMTTVQQGNGTRMYRTLEPNQHEDLVYTTWFYVPHRYVPQNGGWNNIWQMKSQSADRTRHDPFWLIGIGNRSSGNYLSLGWWHNADNSGLEGPTAGRVGRVAYASPVDIPIGRWFELKVRYRCRGDFTGRVTVWQDGQQIFDLPNVRTKFPGGNCLWSINAYAELMQPSPFTIYADDVSISKWQ